MSLTLPPPTPPPPPTHTHIYTCTVTLTFCPTLKLLTWAGALSQDKCNFMDLIDKICLNLYGKCSIVVWFPLELKKVQQKLYTKSEKKNTKEEIADTLHYRHSGEYHYSARKEKHSHK